MNNLKNILKEIKVKQLIGNDNITISEICFDSRQAKPGSLFVATRGTKTDGHQFIPTAIEKGSLAVVCEDIPAEKPSAVTSYRLKMQLLLWDTSLRHSTIILHRNCN